MEQERKDSKAAKNKGDKKRILSQTTQSMSSVQEDKKSAIVDSMVGSWSYSNASRSRRALVDQLSRQLSIPDTTPVNKYSRTELLALATSPLCREAPLHWDKLVSWYLPSVILQKSHRSSGLVVVERRVVKCQDPWKRFPACLEVFLLKGIP